MRFEHRFLIALVLTISVETAIYTLVLKFSKLPRRFTDIVFAGIFTSGFTLPYLWYLLPNWLSGNSYLVVGEASVVLIEAVILTNLLKIGITRAFGLSLIANVGSYSAGVIIMSYLY